MFSKYIKYTKGTIRFFLKSPFSLCKSSCKFETFAILNGAIFPVTWGKETSKVTFYNRMRHVGVFSTAIVCRSSHEFLLTVCFNILNVFIMAESCIVQFCTDSNKTEHAMHRFPNDANLKRQLVNFVQVKKKISIAFRLYSCFIGFSCQIQINHTVN